MWSGPRNISTAMMRAWENRPDTVVVDEPLYGQYLHYTRIDHPGAQEVIAQQGKQWQPGVQACFAKLEEGKFIHYQKHMTMHLLDHIDKAWLSKLEHCFLIRHPEEVLASYSAVRGETTLYDIGFVQQARLYEFVTQELGLPCVVVDSKDFLQCPEKMLPKLCEALNITFDKRMLNWSVGRRETDGIWSKYWYESVNKSTGFIPYKAKNITLSSHSIGIVEKALPYYQRLYSSRLI